MKVTKQYSYGVAKNYRGNGTNYHNDLNSCVDCCEDDSVVTPPPTPEVETPALLQDIFGKILIKVEELE